MLRRTLGVCLITLLEPARSPAALLALAALVLSFAVLSLGLADDAPSRAWLARAMGIEALGLLLPLGAVLGAAYIIRPNSRQGWAALPVRRAEWFLGAALACGAAVLLVALLLAFGVWLALALCADAGELERVRYAESFRYVGPREETRARPFILRSDERLEFTFDGRKLGETVAGKLQFEIAWTMEQPPERGVPLEITLVGSREVKATTHVQARRRATFSAPHPGGDSFKVVARAIDPALSVGMTQSECRLVEGRESALPSLLWLAVVAACGALLCAGVALAVRSLSTAPTAALAGALILAALTLLPALAPGDAAARARRRDVEGEKSPEISAAERLSETLSGLPPLHVPDNFTRLAAGEAAHIADAPAALWRLLIASALVPLGAALFSRRQMT